MRRRIAWWQVLAAAAFPFFTFPLLAIALLAAPSRALGTEGNGKAATRLRDVAGFTAVKVAGPIQVEVQEGPAFRVEVTADENLLDDLETRVEDGTLRIGFRDRARPRVDARARVALPVLRAAAVGGSGGLHVEARRDPARDVELSVGGSGSVSWKGEAGALEVAVGGSGGVTVEGAAKRLEVRIGGSGAVAARELRAHEASVRVAGSGNAKLTVDGGPLTVESAGSGNVEWWGQASETHVSRAGSGTVTARR